MINNTCTHQMLIMVKQYLYLPNVNNGDNICIHQM